MGQPNEMIFSEKTTKLHNMKTSNSTDFSSKGTKKSSSINYLKNFLKEKTGKFVCDQCVKFFDEESELQEHYKIFHPKHPQRWYPCETCSKKFCNRELLAKHTNEIHNQIFDDGEEPLLSCEFCNDVFVKEYQLRQHTGFVHKSSKPCKICGKVFKTNFEIEKHKQNKHGIEPPPKTNLTKDKFEKRICEECGKILESKSAYYNHVQYHHGNSPIPCDKCGKICKNKDLLQQHNKSIHEKIPCEICGKMMDSGRMKKHMFKSHPTGDEEFPHNCDVCGKGFFDRNVLKVHYNIHTGEKPFKCKYCGLGFAHPRNRRAHEQSIHHGIKRIYKNKGGTNTEFL